MQAARFCETFYLRVYILWRLHSTAYVLHCDIDAYFDHWSCRIASTRSARVGVLPRRCELRVSIRYADIASYRHGMRVITTAVAVKNVELE